MAKTDLTNCLKGLAILAVVTIHVTSAYLFVYDRPWSFAWQIKIIIDQLARFAVPLFVAASGFALAKKYQIIKLNFVDFFLHQTLKLLPWYLIASFVLYFTFHWQEKTWKQIIFSGQGDYHLYFIPMIFQLYLLFPIINWLCQKKARLLLFLALLFEVLFYLFIGLRTELSFNNNGIWPDQRQYLFFGSWLFYFVLGIYLAKYKLSKKLGAILLLIGLIWTIFNSFNLLTIGMNIIIATRFTRVPVLIYSTGLIIYLIRSNWSNRILVALGKQSFQIYLWHTAILRFLLQPFLPYPIAIISSVTLTYILAKIISYVV